MLIKFIGVPMVIGGVIGYICDLNEWLLAALGAATALVMIFADWLISRGRRARRADHSDP